MAFLVSTLAFFTLGLFVFIAVYMLLLKAPQHNQSQQVDASSQSAVVSTVSKDSEGKLSSVSSVHPAHDTTFVPLSQVDDPIANSVAVHAAEQGIVRKKVTAKKQKKTAAKKKAGVKKIKTVKKAHAKEQISTPVNAVLPVAEPSRAFQQPPQKKVKPKKVQDTHKPKKGSAVKSKKTVPQSASSTPVQPTSGVQQSVEVPEKQPDPAMLDINDFYKRLKNIKEKE